MLALELAGGADLSATETASLLGEEAVDEFLDPRGFARQRARAKRLAAETSGSMARA